MEEEFDIVKWEQLCRIKGENTTLYFELIDCISKIHKATIMIHRDMMAKEDVIRGSIDVDYIKNQNTQLESWRKQIQSISESMRSYYIKC